MNNSSEDYTPTTRVNRGKKIFISSCLVLCAIFLALIVYILYYGISTANRIDRKRQASHPNTQPERAAIALLQEQQFENHTCGLHALSAIYRAYGLSPEEENLRFRLGVDTPAIPTDMTSTGTLHPDLFRVLAEDGFGWKIIDPGHSETLKDIANSLSARRPILILITRPENGNLHWVAADEISRDGLRVVDSLKPSPSFQNLPDFLRDQALSLISVFPATESFDPSPQLEGIQEMDAVRKRLTDRESSPSP